MAASHVRQRSDSWILVSYVLYLYCSYVLVLYMCRVVLVPNRSALVTSNISQSHRSFLSTYRWFTIGSIGFVLTGSITLANSYDSGKLMGEDDSTLSLDDYRATWWLVVVSGWFCIFGESFLFL